MIKFLKYWHFAPVLMIFIIVLCAGYLYLIRQKPTVKIGYFITAVLLIIISVCSPLHWLGAHYLFSAHMVSHISLFLIVPPLLVLAIPAGVNENKNYFINKITKLIAAAPWLAWMLGIGIMWFWHIPSIFDSAMPAHAAGINGFLHHVQSISLVIVGIIFWWPVFGPLHNYRLPALKGVLYLFTACISCSLLGLLITFSPAGIYSYYGTLSDPNGFTAFIRNDWGITAETDQQMAGLIMWVPGCLIYLSGALYLLKNWFAEKEVLPLIPQV